MLDPNTFTGLDKAFFTCAVLGLVLLLLRTALGLIGMGHHDVDMSGHGDLGGHDAGDAHDLSHDHDGHGGDAGLRLLTLQGLMGFFLMFGLAGLAFHRGSALGDILSLFGALAIGGATLWLIALLVRWMRGLQSSGTLDLWNAIGEEGTVYLTIPPGGGGQVQLAVQGRLCTMEAVAQDGGTIRTGERVQVVSVVGDRTLVVIRIGEPPAVPPSGPPPIDETTLNPNPISHRPQGQKE